jgi:hypothetical protein
MAIPPAGAAVPRIGNRSYILQHELIASQCIAWLSG